MYRTTIKKENYKEIAKVGKVYRIQWDMIDNEDGTCSVMEENFRYKPEVVTIKEVILGYYNQVANVKIVEGMTYTTVDNVELHPYLSNENQMNYKNAYDLDIIPYTIKNQNDYTPEYYTFTASEQFALFYRAIVQHINDTLQEAWVTKDSIDWTKYEYRDEEEPQMATTDDNTEVEITENVEDIQA